MKNIFLIYVTMLSVFSLNAFARPAMSQESSLPELFTSQALVDLCAQTILPDASRRGYWLLERPHFALTDTYLYTTTRQRGSANGEFVVSAISRENPTGYRDIAHFQSPIRDMLYENGRLWLLFDEMLTAIDPDSGTILAESITHNMTRGEVNESSRAHGMTLMGNRILIAHGTLGLSIYDISQRMLIYEDPLGLNNNGYVSQADSVTVLDGHRAVVLVENLTLDDGTGHNFDGLIVLDFKGSQFQSRYQIDHKNSGWLAQATIRTDGDTLFVNNWGTLLRTQVSSLKDGIVNFEYVPVVLNFNGHQQFGNVMGDFLLQSRQIFVCAEGVYPTASESTPRHMGVPYWNTY